MDFYCTFFLTHAYCKGFTFSFLLNLNPTSQSSDVFLWPSSKLGIFTLKRNSFKDINLIFYTTRMLGPLTGSTFYNFLSCLIKWMIVDEWFKENSFNGVTEAVSSQPTILYLFVFFTQALLATSSSIKPIIEKWINGLKD